MFPGAHASVYRNEEGEVLGWDNESSFEPPYCDDCGLIHGGPCPEEYDEDDEQEDFPSFD